MPEKPEEKTVLELTKDIINVSACERKIKVSIPRSEIDRYYGAEFSELEHDAYVPGFRVGKAPRKLIEKRFRKDVADRVKNTLVVDALTQINEGEDFTAISEPDFDYAALVLNDDGPFVFEFSIEVRPEFDLPNWKGLKIEKPVREFTDADVDNAVHQLLANYGSLEPKDSEAEGGDYIVTKLTFKDGEKVITSADSETIRIKSVLSFHDCSIENFDKLILGKKAGDTVSTPVTLSASSPNTEYQSKTLEAVFEIREIRKLVLPQLSSDFLERIGGYETEADFRDAVLDSLKRQLEHEQSRRARKQITEALTVSAAWDLPPTLLKKQSERELRRTMMELERSGYRREDIQSQLNVIRQDSAQTTAQMLKEHFILEKIAEVEKVEDTPEDYNTEIAFIAASNGQSPRRVRAQIEKNGEMDILRNQIVERKVLALINENAKFAEVPFEFNTRDEEAMDWAVAGNVIAEAHEEDLKAVNKEIEAKRKADPNMKIK